MEEALQKLELLIHHTGASPEIVTKAFLAACKDYANKQGFDLKRDYLAIHKALLPYKVVFDEDEEHIIIHESCKHPIDSILFLTKEFLEDQSESDFL